MLRSSESGLELVVEFNSEIPIYVQIKNHIKFLINCGKLAGGSTMPTVRALSVDLGVNANTIARVYRELAAEGVIEIRRGHGTFVSEAIPAVNRDEIDEIFDRASGLLELARGKGADRGRIRGFLENALKGF